MKQLVAVLLFIGVLLSSLIQSPTASAAFNPNNIIDESIFGNVNSMDAAAIDRWLNTFPSSCLSTNRGFSAPEPTGYSPNGGFTFGGNVSAGTIIARAAQVYDINPQVLLATLQKEQSLIAGDAGCSVLRYTAAVGYGCPDGGTTYNYSGVNLYTINGSTVTSVNGTCVNSASKAGFSQQIIRGAWLLKFGEQRSKGNIGWAVVKGSWDNSDDPKSCYSGPMTQGYHQVCPGGATTYYDGNRTIDDTPIHIDNGPTASLYWYTPHFHGNQNFVKIFESYFGAVHGPTYTWQNAGLYTYTDSSRRTLANLDNLSANERIYVVLKAKNTGTATWVNSGDFPTRIGTWNQPNRTNTFCDVTWDNCSRPGKLGEAWTSPGEVGTFAFWMKVPANMSVSTHLEDFNLVVDNVAWFTGDFLRVPMSIKPTYSASITGLYPYTDQTRSTPSSIANLLPGDRRYIAITVTNTGNVTWSNSGPNPLKLGTWSAANHTSPFCDSSWADCTRAATLKEASVAPGGTGTFEFWIKSPPTNGTSKTYYEQFNIVAEYLAWGQQLYAPMTITVDPLKFDYSFVNLTNYQDSGRTIVAPSNSAPLTSPNQTVYSRLQVKNTSNFTWSNTGANPVRLGTWGPADHNAALCNGSWISCNRATTLVESSVAPGQVGTFEFSSTVPNGYGNYREYLNLISEYAGWFKHDGLYLELRSARPTYSYSFVSQGAYSDSGRNTLLPNSVNLSLNTNQTAYMRLVVKNTGNTTWSKTTNPLRLGTWSPTDRTSPLCDGSWINCTRAAVMSESTVAPGQNATFEFSITAPASHGSIRDRYNLVSEYAHWFVDDGLVINASY